MENENVASPRAPPQQKNKTKQKSPNNLQGLNKPGK